MAAAGGKITSAGASLGNWALTALSSISSRLITTSTAAASKPSTEHATPREEDKPPTAAPPRKDVEPKLVAPNWDDLEDSNEADEDEAGGWGDKDDEDVNFSSFSTPTKAESPVSKPPRSDDLLIDWEEPQAEGSGWSAEENPGREEAPKPRGSKASSLSPLTAMKGAERKTTLSGPASSSGVSGGAWERVKPKPSEGDFFEELLGTGSAGSKASSVASSGYRSHPARQQPSTKPSQVRKPVEVKKAKEEEDGWDAW